MLDNKLSKKLKESLIETDLKELIKKGEQPSISTVTPETLYESIIGDTGRKLKFSEYAVYQSYLCQKKKSIHGDVEHIPLCNFIPFISRETVEDDGNTQRVMYHISGITLDNKSILPEVYLPAENFSSMNWIQPSWGVRANIVPGNTAKDKIRYVTQLISSSCSREFIYTHLGWRKIYGEWVYLHSAGAIGKEKVTVRLESPQIDKYVLPNDREIDLKMAANASLELLSTASQDITIPLLAMVGLAPLCQSFQTAGLEPAFVLWLSGPSGSRKSSLVACFQAHFGEFKSGKDLPASFRDTMNAVEKKAFLTKDSLLVIDDFHPTYSAQESKRMEQIAQQILRGYGDRVGRSRMRADTTLQKTYPPRGLAIITGEDTPKAGISTTARFLEIELSKQSIDLDKLKEVQEKMDHYSYAFKGYIEWLLPQMDLLPSMLKRQFNKYKSLFPSNETHGRILETAAWILTGLETLLSFYSSVEAIDSNQKEKLMVAAIDSIKIVAQKHALRVVSHDPVMLFLGAIRDLIDLKAISIIDKHDEPYHDDPHFVGWEDGEFYYLIPGKVLKEINHYFQGQELRFPVTKHMILKFLADRDLIVTEQAEPYDRNTVREKLGKKQVRVMKLKKTAVL